MLFFWKNERNVDHAAIFSFSAYGNMRKTAEFDGFTARLHFEYNNDLQFPAPCYIEVQRTFKWLFTNPNWRANL